MFFSWLSFLFSTVWKWIIQFSRSISLRYCSHCRQTFVLFNLSSTTGADFVVMSKDRRHTVIIGVGANKHTQPLTVSSIKSKLIFQTICSVDSLNSQVSFVIVSLSTFFFSTHCQRIIFHFKRGSWNALLPNTLLVVVPRQLKNCSTHYGEYNKNFHGVLQPLYMIMRAAVLGFEGIFFLFSSLREFEFWQIGRHILYLIHHSPLVLNSDASHCSPSPHLDAITSHQAN